MLKGLLLGVQFLREAVMLPGIEYNTDLNSSEAVSSFGVVTVGKVNLPSLAASAFKVTGDDKSFVSKFVYEVSKHRCYDRELQGLTKRVAY